jgi:DNA/RNA endonuclease YhcR with UshA esterase domain
MKIILSLFLLSSFIYAQKHILITEFAVQPTAAEFIEIYNNTDSTIDLSDYYLTDATYAAGNVFYYNIVTGSNAGGGSNNDFNARFPAGSSIAPGEFQTIAITGTLFFSTYAQKADYELISSDPSVADMREALPGSIASNSSLTNSGEVIILYYWNGLDDLVKDVDYVIWGDKDEAVDKTGISIDGPDADTEPSVYKNDTSITLQQSVSTLEPHAQGESSRRTDLIETGEIASGGNGITGHNETSENFSVSFKAGPPNPGTGPVSKKGPVIANVIQDPQTPSSSDNVTISADISDEGQIVAVRLFFKINTADYDSSAMNLTTGNTYTAVLDSQSAGTGVSWFIKAENDSGLISISPTFTYTVTGSEVITNISDIQTNSSLIGQVVTIRGVITVGAGIIASDWTEAYIQDNSGRGINIYRSGTPLDTTLVRGNLLQIRGTVDEYNGITEIVDYTAQILERNQSLPEPLQLKTSEANDTMLEGTFILVKGIVTDKYVAGAGTNLVVSDGSGPVAIRAWDTANLDLSGYSVSDTIAVQGVVDLYNTAAELLLCYQSDIYRTNLTSGGDGSGTVSVSPDSVGIKVPVSLNFTLTGTLPDTVSSVALTIPAEWNWTGNPADVALSGTAFDNAAVNVDNKSITITAAGLTNQNSGTIAVQMMTSPVTDTISTFTFRTAGIGGSLAPVDKQPTVQAGKGTSLTITPIAEIQTNIDFWNGRPVTIRGVVTIGAGILITTRTTAYVQDNSDYGVQIFSFDAPDVNLERGNLVLITGLVEDYQGLVTEITDYTLKVLQKNNDLPDPLPIKTSEGGSLEREGTYVEIRATIIDKYSAGGGTNIIVDDGSGEVTLRIWDSANLDLSGYNIGDGITARGVIGEFSGAGQVLVAYQSDISPLEVTTSVFSLRIPAKPFVPDQGETFPVTYSAGGENTHVIMRIFDLGGRLITTLLDETGKPFEQTLEWNGRDQLNELVKPGAYILHLQVVSNVDGKAQVETAPIVVGTILRF